MSPLPVIRKLCFRLKTENRTCATALTKLDWWWILFIQIFLDLRYPHSLLHNRLGPYYDIQGSQSMTLRS